MALPMRAKRLGGASAEGGLAPKSARWPGSTKNASSSEAQSAATITLGMIAKNFPSTPVIRRSGRKAAQVVAVEAATGQSTSMLPTMAARRRGMPACTCR
ncbi:MAG: hypothetical protein M5U28_52245 [Sandaracinaceae bacterium]|nr:hypothetical protein [Sandaracinaceae bacterium]